MDCITWILLKSSKIALDFGPGQSVNICGPSGSPVTKDLFDEANIPWVDVTMEFVNQNKYILEPRHLIFTSLFSRILFGCRYYLSEA